MSQHNFESKGLSSIMKLLDTLDDGPLSQSAVLLPEKSAIENNLPTDKNKKDGVKRYRWDEIEPEINEVQAESFFQETAAANTNNASEKSDELDAESIKTKMKEMQQEFKKKSGHVEELRTTFARKKLAKETKMEKLKAEWEEKTLMLANKFSKKKQTFQDLFKQNETTTADLKEKKKEIDDSIAELLRRTPTLCRDLEHQGSIDLQKEQERWKSEEKRHLLKIAKEKAASMKSEAANALEPELRKLVEKHDIEKINLRKEVDDNIQQVKDELSSNAETRLKREKQCMEREQEVALIKVDEYHKKKLSDLCTQFDNEIKTLKQVAEKSKEDSMIRFKENIEKSKRDQHRALSRYEKECARDVKAAREKMEARVKQVGSDCTRKAEEEKKQLELNRIHWRLEEKSSLQQRFQALARCEEEKIRKKCKESIDMISRKLCDKLNEKMTKSSKESESGLRDTRERLDSELKLCMQKSKSTQDAYDAFKKDQSDLSEELRTMRARLATSLETLHNLEVSSTNERLLTQEAERQSEEKRSRERSDRKIEISRSKRILQTLEAEAQMVELEQQEKRKVLIIEIEALQEGNEEEVTKAQSKIRHVMGKKEELLKLKEEALMSLQTKTRDMEVKLSEMRKVELYR